MDNESDWAETNEYEQERDITPAEWWDEIIENAADPKGLQAAFDSLISVGCRPVDLFEHLQKIWALNFSDRWKKRDLEAYARQLGKVAHMAYGLMNSDARVRLRIPAPSEALWAHIDDVQNALADREKWRGHWCLRKAEDELTEYVHRHAGGKRHRAVAKLKFEMGVARSAAAQRMATSRLRKRKALKTKLEVPRRRPVLDKARSGRWRSAQSK